MAAKKAPIRPKAAAKAKPAAGKSKSKTVKSAAARPAGTASKPAVKKAAGPRRTAVSIATKAAATRAAEVEANLGGSRPLNDFLSEIGWFE